MIVEVRDCGKRRRGRRAASEPEVPGEDVILRHGLAAFAELGYAGASVRELARRIGVSHNFINDRYGSKAAFWEAAVSFELERIKATVDQVVAAEADDACRLTAVVRELYRMAATNPHLNRVLSDESGRESERVEFLCHEYLEPTRAALEPTLDRLMTAGRIPRLPIHLVFLVITGPLACLTQDPLAHRMGLPHQNDSERIATADALASVVLQGLLQPSGRAAVGVDDLGVDPAARSGQERHDLGDVGRQAEALQRGH